MQVVIALINLTSSIALMYGPYLWPSWDGPRYVIGFGTSAASCFAAVLVCWVIRVLLRRENERIRRNVGAETVINLYAY